MTDRLYSDSILAFLEHLKCIRDSVFKETPYVFDAGFIRVDRSWFRVPGLFVFKSRALWGMYLPEANSIGFHQDTADIQDSSFIEDIMHHEVAHFLETILYGYASGHGSRFKELCRNLGWSHVASSGTGNPPDSGSLGDKKNNILHKVRKLLALAESSHSLNEAQLATKRANELLVAHHLSLSSSEDKILVLRPTLTFHRFTQKARSLCSMIRHFMVFPVFNREHNPPVIELLGTAEDVEVAEYVLQFLSRQLDAHWQAEKRTHSLKGKVAKNSFFRGVAQGFSQQFSQISELANGTELVRYDQYLRDWAKRAYETGLRASHSKVGLDRKSKEIGNATGLALKIVKGAPAGTETKQLAKPGSPS